MKFKNSTSSDRFFQIRNARNTEIAEDYTEMIAELINENGEARVVDLAKNFGVTSPTVNSVIRRLVRDGYVGSKIDAIIKDWQQRLGDQVISLELSLIHI